MWVKSIGLENHRDIAIFRATSFTNSSSINSCPLVISSNPATILRVVVLPHPKGPTKTTNSRSLIFKLNQKQLERCYYNFIYVFKF